MSLLSSVAGFAAFGFGARCFQLGLQKRYMFEAPMGHLYATAAFGLVGWGAFELEKRQRELLAERKADLKVIRDREMLEYQSRKATAGVS
ncbi:hypothetical protein M231_01704 [Tremella mesenterica]|uniref:Uncharacterized protein n=1 Tax=Tremella mesenterica TaxID=5217 RepID=A0A4Q1BSQ7_TREME|nr:hypothetical protein M231_01704 [Tremella mesenterica]